MGSSYSSLAGKLRSSWFDFMMLGLGAGVPAMDQVEAHVSHVRGLTWVCGCTSHAVSH